MRGRVFKLSLFAFCNFVGLNLYSSVTKQLEIMARVGFKTAAVKEEEAREIENNNSPLAQGEEMISVPPVVAETFERLEDLNNFIVSKQFSELNEDAKQTVLKDFHYLSQISTII